MQNEQLFIICVYKSVITFEKNCNASLAIMLDPYSCIYFSLGHNVTKLIENYTEGYCGIFCSKTTPSFTVSEFLNCW